MPSDLPTGLWKKITKIKRKKDNAHTEKDRNEWHCRGTVFVGLFVLSLTPHSCSTTAFHFRRSDLIHLHCKRFVAVVFIFKSISVYNAACVYNVSNVIIDRVCCAYLNGLFEAICFLLVLVIADAKRQMEYHRKWHDVKAKATELKYHAVLWIAFGALIFCKFHRLHLL